MRSDMKNINRKVLRGFCMGRMFEILRKEKKLKNDFAWFVRK